MDSRRISVFVDSRCLQDPMYQYRGVGTHVSSLLRSRPGGDGSRYHIVALTDERLNPLPAEYQTLFDEISLGWNPSLPGTGSIYINSSPMTHNTRLSLRFVRHENLVAIGVVYDFIPLDWPGYFNAPHSRIQYISQLARLRGCDHFAPISNYSAWRLTEVLGIGKERITVTGACVRSRLLEEARKISCREPERHAGPEFFLTVGGGDRRKNTEIAVRAVQQVRSVTGKPVVLKVVGHYGPDYRQDLERIASQSGDGSFLHFCTNISDAELVDLYRSAVATIAPSHIEGFSLPVVEAAVCGSPVVASTCAAQLELVTQPEALFASDDPAELTNCLIPFLQGPDWRRKLLASQAHLAEEFVEQRVAERFWQCVEFAWERKFRRHSSMINVGSKPRVAFLSPFPPEESGCARFTEMTLKASRPYFDVDLFTEAERPLASYEGFRDSGKINAAVLAAGRYDAVVSVIGNSHFHNAVFEFFETFGGPCILHDSRLTHIYYQRLGPQCFRETASRRLRRDVEHDEIQQWLQDQNRSPATLFVEPIAERARPLMVHTRQFQQLLRENYGINASLVTFPPNIAFAAHELTSAAKRVSRKRLGLQDNVFVIATFGYVHRTKGCRDCIIALDLLRAWNINAELHFVGRVLEPWEELQALTEAYGVTGHVYFETDFVEDHRYRDFMIAADAGISLRTYGFGQPSAALTDSIAACIPTVASSELAQSCDAPSYVRRLQEPWSPLQLAEALLTIYENRPDANDLLEERTNYVQEHSFDIYCQRLRDHLGF
jgi:glycosyltransferase involved in cell wall biosynthesis